MNFRGGITRISKRGRAPSNARSKEEGLCDLNVCRNAALLCFEYRKFPSDVI
jgi:hypothetical protein